jgi:hypothetical protein
MSKLQPRNTENAFKNYRILLGADALWSLCTYWFGFTCISGISLVWIKGSFILFMVTNHVFNTFCYIPWHVFVVIGINIMSWSSG